MDIFKERWKTTMCMTHDPQCWCRMIVTEDWTDNGDYNDERIFIGSGTLNEKEAQHIVDTHNYYLNYEKLNGNKF